MTLAILALAGLLALALLARGLVWAYVPSRRLPADRVRYCRLRLHLRLHPGRGHATVLALWLYWGRLAAFRGSSRTRRSMTFRDRIASGSLAYSIFLGRAHYRHGVRVPLEEHILVMAPPRSGKSGWLAKTIMHFPGPALVTTTRPDLYGLTSGLRARHGAPIAVFNPQNIGNLPSTFRWNPIEGCQDRAVAIRRADAFANALPSEGENRFFQTSARAYLRAMFHAAALAGGDMRLVARWAKTATKGGAIEAEQILWENGSPDWAAELAQLHGKADRTNATNEMILGQALGYMADPALADAVLPAGDDLDIATFLRQSGTLYMIADPGGNDEPPLAPLFAALCTEVVHTAARIGQASPGGRLDPPLFLGLDEIVQVCPINIPAILADAGGKGILACVITHGTAQLASRWKTFGAQAILDTCGVKVWLPGITDTETLEKASKLSGQAAYKEKGHDTHSRHEILTPDMIRQLPPRFALVIRGGLRPVVARLPMAWKDRAYKKARRGGWAVYQAPVQVAVPVRQPAALPVLNPVPVRAALTATPAPVPEPPVTVPAGADSGQFPWLAGDR